MASANTILTLPNGTPVVLRPPQPADAAQILALKQSILRPGIYDALLAEEYGFNIEQESLWIEHSLMTDVNHMLVAEAENRIVGMLFFQPSSEIRCTHWGEFGMGITEAYRGKGIGTALLEALFKWAEEHPKIEKICLKVFDVNPKAVKLYQRLGFEKEGRLKNCLKLSKGKYSDAILMAKFVSNAPEDIVHDEVEKNKK